MTEPLEATSLRDVRFNCPISYTRPQSVAAFHLCDGTNQIAGRVQSHAVAPAQRRVWADYRENFLRALKASLHCVD